MDSLGFDWPLSLLLILLPFAIRFLPGRSKKNEFIYITSLPHYMQHEPKNKVHLIFGVAYAAWFFLAIALTRPIYYDQVIVINKPHRDIMLAVDISDSMEIKDIIDVNNKPVSRMQVVKQQIKEFIEDRDKGNYNDRIGVILFFFFSYVLSPLTFDKKMVLELVDEIDASMAGQLTNIGEAINLAIERFEEAGTNQKILVLLSDGKNTAEGINPLDAAAIAKDKDMKIYTIGFGGGTYTTDERGNETLNANTDLDTETLQKIADMTHGRSYHAQNSKVLHGKYKEISFLEASESDPQSYQPKVELYSYPLIISLILSVLTGILVRRING